MQTNLFKNPNMNELTVFSFGGGQDSTAVLYKLVHDPAFRKRYAPNKLLIIMSDTGDEHPKTYLHIEKIKKFCKDHNLEFYFITKDMGYHSATWQTLHFQFRKNSTIGSVAYPQTCTDNLKVKVIDRFVEAWIKKTYGYTGKRKKAYWEFFSDHGKINLILCFGANEGRDKKESAFDGKWKQKTVQRIFPLVEIGWDRIECQDYIKLLGYEIPPPSNCMTCFYMSLQELLWLYRFMPAEYSKWVDMEKAKIDKYNEKGVEKNLGVFGTVKLIPDKLKQAEEKYGHWTDQRLEEYKMSHGHCVKSKY